MSFKKSKQVNELNVKFAFSNIKVKIANGSNGTKKLVNAQLVWTFGIKTYLVILFHCFVLFSEHTSHNKTIAPSNLNCTEKPKFTQQT